MIFRWARETRRQRLGMSLDENEIVVKCIHNIDNIVFIS